MAKTVRWTFLLVGFLAFLTFLAFLAACAAQTPLQTSCATPTCGPCGCPPSNPTDQAILNAAFTHAWQTVAIIQTRSVLSATPTPTASLTPTITPSRTPQPTSTLWRVEPQATPVARQRIARLITDQHLLPDFELGIHRESDSLSPEQIQDIHAALLTALSQNGFIMDVDTFYFSIADMLDLDWDSDGQIETALLYSLGNMPWMRFGVAVMRGTEILAVGPEIFRGAYARQFVLRAVPFAPKKAALFVHLLTTTSGSGVYPRIEQRMYLVQQNRLHPLWQWGYSGGGRAGWAHSWGNFEQLRLMRLSGQPEIDILLSRFTSEWMEFDNPKNYLFYSVNLPGELLFSFQQQTGNYQLTHFYDGARLQRIRPADFILHAPRLRRPIDLDGRFYDWYQTEYIGALNGYGQNNISRSPGLRDAKASFDDSYLYIFLQTNQKTPLWVGLDTNLTDDFESNTLTEDDLLIEITLSEAEPPRCQLEEAALVFPRRESLDAASRPQEYWDAFCNVELRVPLHWLGMRLPLVSGQGYALRPRLDPHYDRPFANNVFTEYYPRPGQIIGFAAAGMLEAAKEDPWLAPHYLPFDPQNPATWGTLIFITER